MEYNPSARFVLVALAITYLPSLKLDFFSLLGTRDTFTTYTLSSQSLPSPLLRSLASTEAVSRDPSSAVDGSVCLQDRHWLWVDHPVLASVWDITLFLSFVYSACSLLLVSSVCGSPLSRARSERGLLCLLGRLHSRLQSLLQRWGFRDSMV